MDVFLLSGRDWAYCRWSVLKKSIYRTKRKTFTCGQVMVLLVLLIYVLFTPHFSTFSCEEFIVLMDEFQKI